MSKILVQGKVEGVILKSENPINFLGTVDKKTGIISDKNHDLFEKSEELLLKSQQIDKEYFYTWNGIAILKKKQGILNEYYEACKNSLKYSNNNEQKKVAFNNLGDYYHSIEEYEKASEFFQKSLEIDKSFENAISGLIDSLWKIKK